MSRSLLYHAFGVRGYRYVKTEYAEGDRSAAQRSLQKATEYSPHSLRRATHRPPWLRRITRTRRRCPNLHTYAWTNSPPRSSHGCAGGRR